MSATSGELREALESMVYQFAYWSDGDPPGHITGGLSALEEAFAVLGWDEPHPAPFQQCDEPGCRKQGTSGTPTLDGYRRTCHEHYPKAGNDAWNAAVRASGLSYSDFVDQQRERLAAAAAAVQPEASRTP